MIRIRNRSVRIQGSGSVSKCHGSGQLILTPVYCIQYYFDWLYFLYCPYFSISILPLIFFTIVSYDYSFPSVPIILILFGPFSLSICNPFQVCCWCCTRTNSRGREVAILRWKYSTLWPQRRYRSWRYEKERSWKSLHRDFGVEKEKTNKLFELSDPRLTMCSRRLISKWKGTVQKDHLFSITLLSVKIILFYGVKYLLWLDLHRMWLILLTASRQLAIQQLKANIPHITGTSTKHGSTSEKENVGEYYWVSPKGQCHETFDFMFFSWICFTQAFEYPIRALSNLFKKIHRDIRSSRCTTGVIETGGKWKKS